LGYEFVEWQVLNSKDFGVPQNRERVFIVASLGEECKPEVFPIRGKNKGINKKVIGNIYPSGYESGDVYHPSGSCSCIGAQGNHEQNVAIFEERIDEGVRYFKNSKCGTIRSMDSGGDKKVIENMRIRKLTPKECWRLQGYPDGAFDKAKEVNSDSQLYKQAGNSVTTNVISAIGNRLNNIIKQEGL